MSLETLRVGFRNGWQTTWILGKVIFPVTLIVTLLSFTPLLDWVVRVCQPFMGWLGLPGEAAIPLVIANVLNLYAGIGAILSLELTVKEVFILAMMMSFSHNLFIETVVSSKVGVKASVVVLVRVGLAVLSAVIINLSWGGGAEPAQYGFLPDKGAVELTGWLEITVHALQTAFMGIFQLAMIVFPLMIFIQWMKDLKFLDVFTRWMQPVTKTLGLSPNTATALSAGLLFGLAYGAGLIIQAVKEDHLQKRDIYLLFIFLVACHAVIEDTLIFIPLGIPVWPLLVIRLVIAAILTIMIALLWKRVDTKRDQPSEGVRHEI